MKNFAFVLLLFVAGCGLTHQPRLASDPSDKEIYQKDLANCRGWAFDKMQEIASYDKDCQRMGSAFGLYAAFLITKDVLHLCTVESGQSQISEET